MEKSYFLCSEEVIKAFPDCEKSKPFKSGYDFEKDENYYVSALDLEKVTEYYFITKTLDFWCRECVPGNIDVSKITMAEIKRKGLFVVTEEKTGLTLIHNRAMTIYNLSEKYNCTPIEFINKIVK